MPYLAAMIVNIVTGIATWLLKFFSQRMAFWGASAAVLIAMSVAVYVSLRFAMSSAVNFAASYHPMFGVGVSMVISPQTAGLLTTYLAFWSGIELYKFKKSMTLFWGGR